MSRPALKLLACIHIMSERLACVIAAAAVHGCRHVTRHGGQRGQRGAVGLVLREQGQSVPEAVVHHAA
jgi:hypothetical protein